MQKYEENLAANTSGALRPLSGASVTVTDQATGLPAFLYSDNGVTPLAQPLATDNDGYFGFYAADGKYTLTFTSSRFAQFTRSIVLEDPDDNPYATLAQLNAGSGALLVRHGETPVGEVLDKHTQSIGGLTQSVDDITQTLGDLAQVVEDIDTSGSYTLPVSSATVLGGIKLGANLTADAGGVVSAGLTNGAIASALASVATIPRTHTFPDKDGTVPMMSDLAGAPVVLAEAPIGTVLNIDYLNIFTSAYTGYKIELLGVVGNFGQTSSTLRMQLAVGGVLNTSASYAISGALNNAVPTAVILDLTNMNSLALKSVFYRTGGTGTASGSGGTGMDVASVPSGFRISPAVGGFAAGGIIRITGVRA